MEPPRGSSLPNQVAPTPVAVTDETLLGGIHARQRGADRPWVAFAGWNASSFDRLDQARRGELRRSRRSGKALIRPMSIRFGDHPSFHRAAAGMVGGSLLI